MDFKKIKSFKNFSYKYMSDAEKERYTDRSSTHPNGATNSSIYRIFPYCDDTEKLVGTKYDSIYPIGAFTPDFLIQENNGKKREVSTMIYDFLGLSLQASKDICNFLSIKPKFYDETLYREDKLFNLFLMNNFMHQDKIDNYGEFIEQKGNEVYDEEYMKFKLDKGEHTERIVEVLNFRTPDLQICLNISSNSTKKDVEFLKTLKKDEMVKIVNSYSHSELYSAVSNRNKILDAVLYEIRNNDDKSESNQIVIDVFTSLMSKESKDISLLCIDNYGYEMHSVQNVIVEKASLMNSKRIMAHDIYPILKAIEENKDEISLHDYVAFMRTLSNVRFVAKTGNIIEYVEILKYQLDRSVEDFLETIKLFVDTALTYNGKLPTMKEWKNELCQENSDPYIPASLLIPMIVAKFEAKRDLNTVLLNFRLRMSQK